MSIELPHWKPLQTQQKQPSHAARANINRLFKLSPQSFISTPKSSFNLRLIYFSPESTFAICYNSFYLVAFYFLQVHVTFTMTFGLFFLSSELSNDLFALYYWVFVGFYVIDMALTFVKGYYHRWKGIIIDDMHKMARRYLMFQFWIDLMTIGFLMIPYLSRSPNSELAFFVPLFLTWIKKYQIQHEFIHSIQYYKKLRILAKIVLLSCDLLLIGHYGACLFLKIDELLQANNVYANQELYWYNINDPSDFTEYNGHWYLYYLFAQSFSTGTLSTICPGPFAKNPISTVTFNNYQQLFALFVSTFYILLTSYVADTLIDILQAGSDQRLEYEEGIEMIGKFMREKKVTLKLQVFVINYFEIVWEFYYKHSQDDEGQVVAMLPQSLKRDLILELSFIRKVHLFKSFNNNQLLMYELSKKIQRKFINQNTLVFFDADSQSNPLQLPTLECNSINFLAIGMVEYFVQCHGTTNNNNDNKTYHLALSNVNKFIGFLEFFTKQALFYNCRTLELCELSMIGREEFDQVIRLTKNWELMHKVTVELLVYGKNELVNRICMVCGEQDHLEASCPQIFVTKRFKVSAISKCRKGTQQRNAQFKRKNYISSQSHTYKLPTLDCDPSQSFSINYRQSLTLTSMMNKIIVPTLKKIGIPKKIARSEDFQKCKTWKQYYKEFNLVQPRKNKGNN